LFEQRKPKHLRVAVLLDKPERRIAAVHADYVTTSDFQFLTNLWSVMGLIMPSVTETYPTLASYCLAPA